MAEYKLYWADLHIHSALSPCADDTMTPQAICEQARKTGLSIIALTDHNSVLNCPALMDYARMTAVKTDNHPADSLADASVNASANAAADTLLVIPGMELQTREEVHLVCLFTTLEAAMDWHIFVNKHLLRKPNRPEYFGNQLIFDNAGKICDRENNLLLGSTDLSFEEVFLNIKSYQGRIFPAHVDRSSFSVLSNLGFIPPNIAADVIEISHHYSIAEFCTRFPQYAGYRFVQNSDAHRLAEIGQGRTEFCLAELTHDALINNLFQNS